MYVWGLGVYMCARACEGHVFQKVMSVPKPRGVCSCMCGV